MVVSRGWGRRDADDRLLQSGADGVAAARGGGEDGGPGTTGVTGTGPAHQPPDGRVGGGGSPVRARTGQRPPPRGGGPADRRLGELRPQFVRVQYQQAPLLVAEETVCRQAAQALVDALARDANHR